MPDDAAGALLHNNLLAGDPTAPAQIAEAYLPLLVARLARMFPHLPDPAFVEDAVHTALINYFGNPQSYNPQKLSLLSYLLMAARGDLLNLIDREQHRYTKRQIPLDVVELGTVDSEHWIDKEADPANRDLDPDEFEARLAGVLPDPRDRAIAHLMMDDVRSTMEYAYVLEAANLPLPEQRALVKRHKDRIIKRLQRARIRTRVT
jgi:hypothetical protein